MYKTFADRVKAPILANITEFGATPLYTTEELASVDVSLVLYPLSAFRAMNKAAENVYTALRRDGTQKNVVDTMQTRMELYDAIGYHAFEQASMRCSPRRRLKVRGCAGVSGRFAGKTAPTGFSLMLDDAPDLQEWVHPTHEAGTGNRISQQDSITNSRKENTPWPKQKYSVAQACVARWPARPRCRPLARPVPA